MSTNPKTFLTPEQYLEIERKTEYKSEYYNGEMFAMAGAKEAHNLLVMNAGFALHPQLRSRPCRIYVYFRQECVGLFRPRNVTKIFV